MGRTILIDPPVSESPTEKQNDEDDLNGEEIDRMIRALARKKKNKKILDVTIIFIEKQLKKTILSLVIGENIKDIELLKFIEDFKENLIDYGVHCSLPTVFGYSENRKKLLQCDYVDLVPDFIKKQRTEDELWEFIKLKYNNYADRRKFFKDEFNPILEKLESNLYAKKSTTSEIKGKFNSEYIKQSIDLMDKLKETNPTEAIGKAKELVESCCKTILDYFNEEYKTTDDLSTLTKKTFKKLNLLPEDIDDKLPLSQTLKQILGSLRGVCSGLAELRNAYGIGHGKSDNYKGLEPRHSKLAVGSAVTLVTFLWDCYEYQKSKVIK